MVVIIDNYDSFVYNLVQYVGEYTQDILIFRNDQIEVEKILDLNPSHIIISPGPCAPNDAGISLELIEKLPSHICLLGVCLGHQCIGQAFGGKIINAPTMVHGKTSEIQFTLDHPLFSGNPMPFLAVRYHSLVVDPLSIPSTLIVDSWCEDGTIMSLRHQTKPIFGIQFHPESWLTFGGKKMIENFLSIRDYRGKRGKNDC